MRFWLTYGNLQPIMNTTRTIVSLFPKEEFI